MGESALIVDTSRRFADGFIARPRIDLRMAPGEILVLFGPSGAGKTTMLREIAGLETPDSGTIRYRDALWFESSQRIDVPPQQRRVGLVFQAPTLFPHLSVRGNVAFGAAADPARVNEMAALLEIGPLMERRPNALSGGQAQRVALARALAPNPGLLLLDEPLAALDAPTRARLRRDVRALLQRTGTPAIFVTHDRSEALSIGDHLAVVIDGSVRQIGAVAEVFSRPVDAEVAASLGVEAVLPGRIQTSADGLLVVDVQNVLLHIAERQSLGDLPIGANVYVCVRAEDVTLETSTSVVHASARNHLPARVVAIAPEGPVDRVALDCGFPLDALITRRSREEMELAPGAAVVAAIKATSMHVVPRS